MDVQLPDGTTVKGVPDGTSKAELATKLKANGRDVPAEWFAPEKSAAEARKPDLFDKVRGGIEAVGEPILSVASSIPASIAGNVAGAVDTIAGGGFGTPEATRRGAQRAQSVTEALTYVPRNKAAQGALETAGKAFDASKIAGLNPAIGFDFPRGAAGGVREAGRHAGSLGAEASTAALEDVISNVRGNPPATGMAGIGSAETDAAKMRRERAASLPVPLNLSKGQAERGFEQQRFERETAKQGKVGEPLRQHYAEQNSRILQNFDSWVDQVGAESPNLRATGQAVDKALVDKSKKAKSRINDAYEKARTAGELEAPVATDALVEYLEKNRPAAVNAPVLTTIEQKLLQLGGATRDAKGALTPGRIPLNDFEEIRKLIGQVSDSTPTNAHFGREAKGVIDAATEGAGGKLYKEARKLRYEYGKEFEQHGAIDKLLSTKTGTTDRKVAFEDVFSHSILSGSYDDLAALRRTLQTGGDAGQQAWKELQGETLKYLKQEATKGISTDIKGNPIVSAAGLDRAIKNLDREGKLDLLYGKKGAQQLRDVNDIAKDVFTSPPGAVNTSGTGAVVLEALSNMVVGKLPTALGKGLSAAKGYFDERKTRKRVKDSIGQLPVVPGGGP